MIYNKPFYVFNGMEDSRISSILEKAKLFERSIDSFGNIENIGLVQPHFNIVNEIIDEERQRSREYLIKALDI